MMSGNKVYIVIALMAAITFAARAFPFAFFKRRRPPRVLDMIEKNIPPAIMVILVFFSIKDGVWLSWPYGLPECAGILSVVLLHLWKRNAMLSIAAGTACYMILIRVL
ncbi:MAG: branched-chain amino acid transporter permease [Spirochaetota bacterium]